MMPYEINFRRLRKFPLCFILSGCAYHSAPSFPILGAYFPGWLICIVAGGVSVLLFRILFLKLGWDNPLTDRLLVYISLGVLVGLGCWMLWFGR